MNLNVKTVVIIPAGGSGSRFGGLLPKQFVELDSIPLIVRTLMNFDSLNYINGIIIAIDKNWEKFLLEQTQKLKRPNKIHFVNGGEQRQDSVFNALNHKEVEGSEIVLIHDAVRPFINEKLILRLIESAQEFGAVIPALPPKETIKFSSTGDFIEETPERNKLFSVQTPQVFRTEIIKRAYANFIQSGKPVTDDASYVEYSGFPVKILSGLEENIKITTQMDFELAKLLLNHFQQTDTPKT